MLHLESISVSKCIHEYIKLNKLIKKTGGKQIRIKKKNLYLNVDISWIVVLFSENKITEHHKISVKVKLFKIILYLSLIHI